MSQRISDREQTWLGFYLGQSKENAADAARRAGYKTPAAAGYRLKKKFSKDIDARKNRSVISAEEALSHLAQIARDPVHKDRLRAVELALRVHGLLSEKLSITVDRTTLVKQLEQEMAKLQVIDAKGVRLLSSDNKSYVSSVSDPLDSTTYSGSLKSDACEERATLSPSPPTQEPGPGSLEEGMTLDGDEEFQ